MSAPETVSLPARARSYALAIFLGSTLLFLLEPIAAKRLVPLLGGSAAVWTACLVFFQTALLLGYYVAHLLVTRTNLRTQVTAFVGRRRLRQSRGHDHVLRDQPGGGGHREVVFHVSRRLTRGHADRPRRRARVARRRTASTV